MTASDLARASIITNKSSARTQPITKFTPHYMCADWSGETCARYFQSTDRQCSANYCIGTDGGIVCNVPEERRAWTSSSSWNDQRAITVECGNKPGGVLTDATWRSLVRLGADVMRRYGFRPWWTGDSSGTITCHYMFASTDCPGPWLSARMGDLAVAIKQELDGTAPRPAPEPEEPKVVEVPSREPGGELAMKTIQGAVRRLYNPYNGDHVYSTDKGESDRLVGSGYLDEGSLGTAPTDVVVLYRLYNFDSGEHLLTESYAEALALAKKGKSYSDGRKTGWHSEGEPFVAYVGGAGPVKVHRLYDANGGFHLLTSDAGEMKALASKGWKDEGVKFSLDE